MLIPQSLEFGFIAEQQRQQEQMHAMWQIGGGAKAKSGWAVPGG